MRNALYLGSVAGIRISVHWTFLLLIGWIIYSNLNRGADRGQVIWAVLFVLTIFVCVTLHELGHALTAQRFHVKTAAITLLPIGGVAQMESIPEKPSEELAVALGGPAVNVVIFAILYFVLGGPPTEETLAGLDAIGPHNFLPALMYVNLMLAVFNMIPAFPMDGGRVLRALLAFRLERARATRIAANIGKFLAIGFVLLGFYGNPFLALIGVFIFLGAEGEARQTETQAVLRGFTVRQAMLLDIPTLHPDDTIATAVDRLLAEQNKYFVVGHDNRIEGTIGRDEIIAGLRRFGETGFVRDAMRTDVLALAPDLPIDEAWQQMQQRGQAFAVITEGGALIGAIDLDNVTEFVLVRGARRAVGN